ncbi:Mpo1-like protein [Stratiformator vulcanicus]|uniref:DUF962 domain-containing protein n=1 Tax=Stratiformator vulcanicus TaxID=2527980 RepID=A0A517QZ74_9PLAN|nr:Mpo1-like protein [Stratiformator vulcanicus]QDT36840.1 hypothetical protein Pan189_12030 [Stratiformator vulcanicus]
MLKSFLANYVQRHRDPVNQVLHVIGLPVTFVAPIVFFCLGDVWNGIACFVIGYVLQFLGHAVEGNEAGEVVLVKKWLGFPYVEFGPKANRPETE